MAPRIHHGFTLPELLIVVTVMAVLLGAGAASFGEFTRDQRVKNASFDLFSSLVAARSEAIARNTSVTLTPLSMDNWANGWTITYVDGGGSAVTLREQGGFANIAISGPASVVYRGSGRLTNASAPQFQLTASGATVTTRCINLDLSGRPVSKAAAC